MPGPAAWQTGGVPQNVLLAEDDRAIRHALERALTLEGYAVTAVADGVEALARPAIPPDVLVLDVMMPGIDGLQVCRVLRAGDRTPILMLTALVETADRIAGLDAEPTTTWSAVRRGGGLAGCGPCSAGRVR